MTKHILKNENRQLQHILARVKDLSALKSILLLHLNQETAKHCDVIKYEKNCLFLMLSNAHWVTQIRYQIPDLIQQLKQHHLFKNINGIICKTRPNPLAGNRFDAKTKRTPPTIQLQTSQFILQVAERTKDQRLQAVLQKLASRSVC